MGRYSNRKAAASVTGLKSGVRTHSHKAHVHGNGKLPYGVGHTRQNRFQNQAPIIGNGYSTKPIGLGLVGLAGAGILGFALMNKKKTFGVNSFGTSGVATGKVASWRKFLPFKSALTLPIGTPTGFATAPIATGIANTGLVNNFASAPTGILNNGIIGNVAKAPIVHNRKVPIKERVLSKVTGRPVVTNYH